MATTDPTRENITTANGIRSGGFALGLTEYAMHASPEQLDRQMRRAYGDLVPGSVARQRAVEADLTGRLRDTEPVQRRLAEIQAEGSLGSCDHCGQPFEPLGRNHRFCSPRCQRRAARLREMARQPTGDPAAVSQECRAAYARLTALVAEQDAR